MNYYSGVPVIRPPMVFVKSGFDSDSEQVSLMKPVSIEKMHFGTETSGLNGKGGLNFEWSL